VASKKLRRFETGELGSQPPPLVAVALVIVDPELVTLPELVALTEPVLPELVVSGGLSHVVCPLATSVHCHWLEEQVQCHCDVGGAS